MMFGNAAALPEWQFCGIGLVGQGIPLQIQKKNNV
jgi:hypothetical protein